MPTNAPFLFYFRFLKVLFFLLGRFVFTIPGYTQYIQAQSYYIQYMDGMAAHPHVFSLGFCLSARTICMPRCETPGAREWNNINHCNVLVIVNNEPS